ncbi:MAG: hypothetical protein WAW37_09645 [Syntrophobacteraceae bacterium]
MASICHYCQTEGDFDTFRNPETGMFRPTCGQCGEKLAAYQKRVRLMARVRMFGVPVLALAAILWLLAGNWQASVLSAITAGLIATTDPEIV